MRLFIFWFFLSFSVLAEKPIVLEPSYDHDKFKTLPRDYVKQFRAFTSSMDTEDDDNSYGGGSALGTPEWVAYEIKRYAEECIPTQSRPEWKSEKSLVEMGIAPTDDSYKYSRPFRNAHKDWFVRGHLQMKLIAERMGHDAAANTHTFLNAVPQRSKFNGGIWLNLEYITTAWAQTHGSIWVVTGPVYVDDLATSFIGDTDEFPVAVPDALFKIVIKETNDSNKPDVLAFLYPQIGAGYYSKDYDHSRFLTSVDEIEELTGNDFLTLLSASQQRGIEKTAASAIWSYQESDIIRACRN